jgi:peptidoglycan/LPS O-acetylase OafA/YrhL
MGYSRPIDQTDSWPLVHAPAMSAAANKLLGLELLRFISALAVLLYHYVHFLELAGAAAVPRGGWPAHALLWPLYDYGQFGVQVFWGISGYIFFWKYGAAIRSGVVAARDFFWLRFSRLYPLHIATLVAVVGLQAVHRQLAGFDYVYPAVDPGLFTRQLFLATDWGSPAPFSFNGPIWSISAEVAVYGAFFLAMRWFTPSRNLCVAVILGGLGLQLAGLDWGSIGCATYFFAGGLATFMDRQSVRPAATALGLLMAGCWFGGMLEDRSKLPMILLVAVPALLLLSAQEWKWLDRWQGQVQFAGNLTYSSYLLHFPLQLMLAVAVAASGWRPPLASPLFLVAYLGVTLALAAASYRWFELPAQQWLRQRTVSRIA